MLESGKTHENIDSQIIYISDEERERERENEFEALN